MLRRPKIKYFIQFLRNSQLLSCGNEVVNFSLGLSVVLRSDLVKQQKVAIEHLKTVDKFVSFLILHLNGIFRFDDYFVGFDIGSYFE